MKPAPEVLDFGVNSLKPNSITLASSELAPNMFGASSELASVMEFGFYEPYSIRCKQRIVVEIDKLRPRQGVFLFTSILIVCLQFD